MPLLGMRVLVTGASSGIGAAIAREAAERGAQVILTARRPEALEAVTQDIQASGGTASWYAADLTREADRAEVLNSLREDFGIIDVLVCNAGAGWYGPSWEMKWPQARALTELNVLAPLHLTLEMLPEMVARRSGRIIVIGSIAGSLPAQGIAVYAAGKAFLEGFCRSVYRETRWSGVRISIVKPGFVRTAFFDRSKQASGRRVPRLGRGVSAERVARHVVALMRRRRRIVYVPFWLRAVPLAAVLFGWILDLLGGIDLKPRHDKRR